jgi:hypothetical protein
METLALIELVDRDGQVRHAVRVTEWPVRIGRAIECEVVLDDPHVAPHHASLVLRADGVHVEPLHTRNGVHLGRAKIAGESVLLPRSTTLQMGATTLRVRLAGEALAPELPLADVHQGTGRRVAWLVGLAAVAAVWAGFSQWVVAAPGQSGSEMTALYLGAPIALAIWCSLWALGSKLFQRQFAFWPHLEAALFWPLVAMVVQTLSGQVAFALSAPWVAKAGHLGAIAAIAMLLWRHLSIVLPQRRHAFAIVIATVLLVGGGLNIAERVRHQQPLVGDLYLGTISLPGVRVVKPVSADAFVRSAAPLEKSLSKWAKAGGDDGPGDGGDDD